MRIRFLLLPVLLALLQAGAARADYTFQFTDQNGNLTSAFTVAVGATITVDVWLKESNGATALQTPGLNNGGVSLSYNQSIANVTALAGNSAFDTQQPSITPGKASVNDTQVISGGITAPSSGANTDRILLGAFTFTGVSAGTTTALTSTPHAGSSPPISDNNLADSPNYTSIDSLIANANASITVTAVPEPGTLVLTGLLASLMGVGAWRRRRRQPA